MNHPYPWNHQRTGVDLVGQGFPDELFRVWRRDRPEIEISIVGANAGVRLMLDRVEGPRT